MDTQSTFRTPRLIRRLLVVCAVALIGLLGGCDGVGSNSGTSDSSGDGSQADQTLREARAGFATTIINQPPGAGRPDQPPQGVFELIDYESPVGDLAAYVTPDPGDGEQHPAIIWITGGDNNTIGDVWSQAPRSNDQSARAYREAGIVMMFPSQRGGNDNPGKREGFYGEVDDILAAADHLAQLPYVDPDRIYLGGHSTGGTMAMLVAASTDRFRAVFAFGPVGFADAYGGNFVYCDLNNEREMALRSPANWLHCVESPMFVIEGTSGHTNTDQLIYMKSINENPLISFFPVNGCDHFSVLAPVNELIAPQIVSGQIELDEQSLRNLR